jgi:MFS family permease
MAPESVASENSARGTGDENRTITDVIDDIGCGLAQVRLAVLAGGVNYTNGLCLELIGVCPASIALDLSLHAYQRASLYSGALAGKLAGNFTAVIVNTSLGRKFPIVLGYFLAITFITCSAFGYNVYVLVACWFLVGFGMGFAGPNWWSLCSEASPTNKRMAVNAFSMMLFSVGALVALGVAYTYAPDLKFGKDWRNVILWVQTSNVVLFLAVVLIGFVDSAHAYAARGNISKAAEILETMRQQNGSPNVSIHFVQEHNSLATPTWLSTLWVGLSTMFNREYIFITCVMFMLTFTLNFATYGLGYAMPLVLSSLDTGFPAVMVMIVCEIFMVLGYFNATFISKVWGRRGVILGPFLGCGTLAFMCMAYGLFRIEISNNQSVDSVAAALVLGAAISFKFIMAHGWLIVYLYATEVFPTVCRSSAVGLVLGMGRVGSISTAYVFEGLHQYTGHRSIFFGLVCLLMALDAIGTWLCLPETKGKKLELFNSVSENTPLKKT